MPLKFIYKSTCDTCRRARKFLQSTGASFEERDMSREPLTEAEVRALIGERETQPFLNFRNELYRERKMKANPPVRDEAFALMGEHPNLIRRPLLVNGDEILLGFDEAAYRCVASGK
jgi:Spx/MgsR family transcriptional regulator